LLFASIYCSFAYAEDGESKVIETYYENGVLESRGTYRWGRKNGIFREYYDNGQIKSICSYRQDVLLSKENFENSTANMQKDFAENGVKLNQDATLKPKEKGYVDIKNKLRVGLNAEGELPQEAKENELKKAEEAKNGGKVRKVRQEKEHTQKYIKKTYKELNKVNKQDLKHTSKYEEAKYEKELNLGGRTGLGKAETKRFGADLSDNNDKYKKEDYKYKKKKIDKYKKTKFVNTKPDGLY